MGKINTKNTQAESSSLTCVRKDKHKKYLGRSTPRACVNTIDAPTNWPQQTSRGDKLDLAGEKHCTDLASPPWAGAYNPPKYVPT